MIQDVVDLLVRRWVAAIDEAMKKGDNAPFPTSVTGLASGAGIPEGFRVKITLEFVEIKPEVDEP